MARTHSILTVISLLWILITTGCSENSNESPPTSADGQPRYGGLQRIGLQQEPSILNNILQLGGSSSYINNCIFSRFVTYNADLELVTDLITEIPSRENGGVSADYLTYTYHLRQNAKWHDGIPVTSDDVRFTFEIIMDPEAGAESQEGWDIIDRLETPDAHTVVFHLSELYSNFVGDTFFDEDILPKHLLKKERGKDFANSSFHRKPVGCGPFKFVEWVPGSHIKVERFADYHGEGPYLDAIIFKFVPEATSLALQLRSSEIDGWWHAEASQFAPLKKLGNIKVYESQSMSYTHLTLNCESPILADERVRRALLLATNREEIARFVFDGLAVPALSGRYPLTPWYWEDTPQYSHLDLEASRRLLEEAGWIASGVEGLRQRQDIPLKLVISTGTGRPVRERIQAVIQQQWRQVGVEVEIRNYEMRTLIEKLGQSDFDVALFGWGASPDPGGIVNVYGTGAGQNFGRFSSQGFDDLLAESQGVFAHERRVKIFHAVEKILLTQVPAIPLVWQTNLSPMNKRLQNFKPNPSSATDSWNVATWWLSE